MGGDVGARIRQVTAVLGPTNTGKTHLAIERMLGHKSGLIGLPLRLLAREVYDKIGKRIGFDKVALVTGEEKIKPKNAAYWVSTVEAMPRDLDVSFLAIDEVQLAADPERGHVFTDRLLRARGSSETLLLGAQTMRDVIMDLIPGANFISRPRLSKLTYSGSKKITRLPPRSTIVAFSANEVYSLAELVRRQSGGAAVVLGALSPRTRNAQVGLYQSGEVDYLVATDAIGMGLNLDVNHVAFAARRKFDGQKNRDLIPSELAQIAGRAGRHMNDGTFGVTGTVEPFSSELIERLETHNFEPVRVLQWRNHKLDFASLDLLKRSLGKASNETRLVRARLAEDVEVFELMTRDEDILKLTSGPSAVARLWDVCQVPDYRKISLHSHAELVSTIYKYLMGTDGRIDEDWFSKQVAFASKTDGDIDTLSNRIAHIRTWTFVSNRSDWLRDPEHWQGKTREIEDQLSDALHERLTQRFIDRRTSALMKGMRDKDELSAEIGDDGSVQVEGHFVGRLSGFRFTPDGNAEGIHGKAAKTAAAHALSGELAMRVRRVVAAKGDAFKLTPSGEILWRDMTIARIEASDDLLKPVISLIVDEDHVAAADREKIRERLDAWLKNLISERLKPLVELSHGNDVSGLAKGIAFRLVENFGTLKRETVSNEIKALDQPARAQLRKFGVRFGAFNIYIPILLKPASAELAATLWAAKHAVDHGLSLDKMPVPPRPGLTSFAGDPETPEVFYRVFGYQVCGPRVVRLDILERLADQIRPLLSWRRNEGSDEEPPKGATGFGGFKATPEMMSILGCSHEELAHVLKALGFWVERRPLQPASSAAKSDGDKRDEAKAEKPDGKETPEVSANLDEASQKLDAESANTPAQEFNGSKHGSAVPSSSDEPVSEPAAPSPETAAQPGSDQEREAGQDPKSNPGNEKPVDGVSTKGGAQACDVAQDTKASQPGDEETSETIVYEEIWKPKSRRSRKNARVRGTGQGKTKHSSNTHLKKPGSRDTAKNNQTSRDMHDGKAISDKDRPEENNEGSGLAKADGPTGKRGVKRGPGSRQSPGRSGGKPRRDGGGARSGDRHGQRARKFHSKAPGNKKGIDPDSPFAALAGLRDELAKSTVKSEASKDET